MRAEDRVLLRHIIDAGETISQFTEGRVRADLDTNRMLLFAVVRAIEVIGEAAAKISEETRGKAPEIPWRAMVGMRNRLIHGYFDINVEIVWKTATVELEQLLPKLRLLLGEREGA